MNLFDFACFFASAYAVKFKDCGSDGIAVKDVSITPCPKEPCELIHGQNYSIKIDFEEQVMKQIIINRNINCIEAFSKPVFRYPIISNSKFVA